MKYLKSFQEQFKNESVWTDSFDPSPNKKFPEGSKFYKLIEKEINELLKEVKPFDDFENDIVGKILFIYEYNRKGVGYDKSPFGDEYETGHYLLDRLIDRVFGMIKNDDEVVKYLDIAKQKNSTEMSDKITRDLNHRTYTTIKYIFGNKIKKALNNEELYQKYNDYLRIWQDYLPDWIVRGRKANLLDFKNEIH